MKLRISGNSIRLRLSRSEVKYFEATGQIEDAVEFGSASKFSYSMTAVEDATLNCSYTSSGIHIRVPCDLAQDWTRTDLVAISGDQPIEPGKTLQILVEKDFQCIHKSSDANADAYPNPLKLTSNE